MLGVGPVEEAEAAAAEDGAVVEEKVQEDGAQAVDGARLRGGEGAEGAHTILGDEGGTTHLF